MTALVIGPDEPRPDLTVVVANDDGGSIFATLEQGGAGARRPLRAALRHTARRRPRRPVRGDPHAALAGRVGAELRQALDSPNGGIEVVEVRCRRDNRRALDEAFRALAHTGHHAESPTESLASSRFRGDPTC